MRQKILSTVFILAVLTGCTPTKTSTTTPAITTSMPTTATAPVLPKQPVESEIWLTYYSVSWSPDSSKIVAAAGFFNSALVIIDSNLTSFHQLVGSGISPFEFPEGEIGKVITPVSTPNLLRYDRQTGPTAVQCCQTVERTVIADKIIKPTPIPTKVRWSLDAPGATEGFYKAAAWAPKSNRIAFVFSPDGVIWDGTGIYTVELDGQNMRQAIISPDIESLGLNWSPDELKLLYTKRAAGGDYWICIANLNGTDERLIRRVYDLGGVAWSPDGTKIAFRTGLNNRKGGLYVMNSDGSNLVTLSEGEEPTWGPGGLTWSPDSTRIAYVDWRYTEDGFEIGVYSVNTDGSNRQLVTGAEAGGFSDLAWSPDGRHLLLVAGPDELLGDRLYMLEISP